MGASLDEFEVEDVTADLPKAPTSADIEAALLSWQRMRGRTSVSRGENGLVSISYRYRKTLDAVISSGPGQGFGVAVLVVNGLDYRPQITRWLATEPARWLGDSGHPLSSALETLSALPPDVEDYEQRISSAFSIVLLRFLQCEHALCEATPEQEEFDDE